jgi:rhodanese-related sulfurtransferase
MVSDITALDLKARLGAADPPLLLDVREGWELAIVRIAGTLDIPMNQIPTRLHELPRNREIVVMCHAGGRSLKVAEYLDANGFRATNLAGGIRAWTEDVDPSLKTY